jgi:predicted metal-dependent hydrolase
MTTENTMTVGGLRVLIVRKDIRNLHLGVYPPDGWVRVATPIALPDTAVRAAVASRLAWIRRQQITFRGQAREAARQMVSGETHWFEGRRYQLRVVEAPGRSKVILRGGSKLELRCPPGSTVQQRVAILDQWYRARLSEVVPGLLETWSGRIGVEAPPWRAKRMRTKWGSWNAASGIVWLNLELAKKPRRALEYVVVHELLHPIERRHDGNFRALLDHFLPHWRLVRAELADLPLAHYPWPD